MNWARHSGFAVAESHVYSVPETLELELQLEPGSIKSALLVRRYDRSPDGRIHQEDLAQAQWLDPEQKYPLERNDDGSEQRRRGLASVEGTGRYVAHLLGVTGFEEYLRRFVFVMASGNGDAHLKNWSLWYPDGRRPQWTPLYDQVSSVAWQDETLACPFFGTRNFPAIGREFIARLAPVGGLSASRMDEIVAETVTRCRTSWEQATNEVRYLPDHRARLIHHWSSVPLLRAFGPLHS